MTVPQVGNTGINPEDAEVGSHLGVGLCRATVVANGE